MKYEDREVVDGTTVVIGRKVQFRKDAEGRAFTRVAKGYTAEYRDGEGKRRFVSLRTNHRREARRLAIELQQRLDDGQQIRRRTRLTMPALIERYTAFNESKSLMPTTLKKYRSDLEKLGRFCAERGVQHASQFTEERYHQFESWLRSQTHKQATTYSSKSVAANLVLTKQMFKWAHRHRLIADNPIASAAIPFAKAKEQPCFTTA
ncbi:MAG: phage integrase SAM-like domain-containing protein, partial [Planctomycetota bacterium]